MEDNFANTVIELFKQDNWLDVLNLNQDLQNESARNLLWVWPSESNLKFIKSVVLSNGLTGITSIGCGCGLLEWIIKSATGIPIIGLEVNEPWWKSKYSNPQFIPLQFPDLPPTAKTLRKDYALLFCYFNNGEAFKEYVRFYKGNIILIVGPGEGRGTLTNPEPFKVTFENDDWDLLDSQEVKSSKDFIAVYKRK